MPNYTIDLTDQPQADWSTRKLRAWIREATRDINKKYVMLEASGVNIEKDHPMLWEERNRLIELGTGKEYRGGIGLGLTYKTKSELKLQARALRQSMNLWAGDVPSEAEEKSYKQAYEQMQRNNEGFDLSFADYKDMVEIMGALGDHVINNFGNSTDFVEAYYDARTSGKSRVDFMDAVVQSNREAKEAGYTTEEMMTMLRGKLEI